MADQPATTGELALEVLRRQAARLLDLAPAARAGHEPEAVHQMRVAARRMRAALRLFDDVLPGPASSHLNAELKWIAAQLGAVRDLDVQVARIDAFAAHNGQHPALGPFRAWLVETERRPAQAALEDALRSPRFVALAYEVQRLDTWEPIDDRPLATDGPRRLRRAAKAFSRRARRLRPASPAADFHQVRIRAKRLRYAAEFLAPLLGKPAQRFADIVAELQDLLGALQDSVVGDERIGAAVAACGPTWPPPTLLALGQVVQWNAQQSSELRGAFERQSRQVMGKAWRRLASGDAMS